MTKVCNQCGQTKPITDFYKMKSKDGRMPRCKVCYKQRDLDKNARVVVVHDPNGDVIEDNKMTKRENDLVKEFLAKREREQNK